MMADSGPIEDGAWAQQLDGHVVDPGPPVRLHGYELLQDLARNYGHAELVLTALVGEVPSTEVGRAFEVALALAMPGSIAEAPAHAAAIARMLAAPAASVVAMAALVLAEQAQALVDAHAEWIAWLEHGEGEPPAAQLVHGPADAQSLALARSVVSPELCPALARREPSTSAIIVALLHACGLRTPATMVAALVTARLPATVAEADRHRRAELRSYPMQLPPFEYREEP